jgi:hypothetical protein
VLCSSAPALAGSAIKGIKLTNNPKAPIALSDGYFGVYDGLNGSALTLQDTCLAYTNRSGKAVTAVRFKYRFFNAFTESIGTAMFADTGTHQAGASDSVVGRSPVFQDKAFTHCWQQKNTYQDNISHVTVAVDTVMFADGTSWHNR